MGRLLTVDIARGFAISLVIIGHALEMFFNKEMGDGVGFSQGSYEAWRAIYAFHMPAFYFISGMVLTKVGERPVSKAISDSLSLLLVALATHLVGVVIAVILANPRYGSIEGLIRPFITGGQGLSLRITWFLVSLAVVQLFALFILRSGIMRQAFAVAIMLALYVLATKFEIRWLYGQTIAAGTMFYVVGHQAGKWLSTRPLSKSAAGGLGVLATGALVVTYGLNGGCLFNPFNSCNMLGRPDFAVIFVNGLFGFLPLFLFSALAGIVTLLCLATLAAETPASAFFSWIGRSSLALLVINGVFFTYFEPMLAGKLGPLSDYSLSVATIVLVVHVAILPFVGPAVDALRKACSKLSLWMAGIAMASFKSPFAR